MTNKLFLKIKKIFNTTSHDRCYTKMESCGIASMGCCCAIAGGDSSTDCLQYECMDCKYLVLYRFPNSRKKQTL